MPRSFSRSRLGLEVYVSGHKYETSLPQTRTQRRNRVWTVDPWPTRPGEWTFVTVYITRSSEGPHDALSQWKSCQILHSCTKNHIWKACSKQWPWRRLKVIGIASILHTGHISLHISVYGLFTKGHFTGGLFTGRC